MNFRRKPSDQVSGFLDKGTNVTGELEFAGTLRIDGNFHGSISTNDTLIVGAHAMVHADIKAGERSLRSNGACEVASGYEGEQREEGTKLLHSMISRLNR